MGAKNRNIIRQPRRSPLSSGSRPHGYAVGQISLPWSAVMTETNKQQPGAVAPARKGKMKNNNKTGAGTQEPNIDSTGPTVPKQGNSRLKTFGNIALGAVVLALFGIGGSSLRGDDG